MRQRIRSHLTYANVMVTILAFIVLGSMSYAATGGNFVLGQSNTASSPTSLSAPVSGKKALQVTNSSSGAGATALGLNVASGHPPFTVNSGTKVANLNADKLDGIDSRGFLPSTGRLTFTYSPLELAVHPPLAFSSSNATAVITSTATGTYHATVPIPTPTRMFGRALKVYSVQICYQGTASIVSTQLRDDGIHGSTYFYNDSQTRPESGCYVVAPGSATALVQGLAMNLGVNFANTSDALDFYWGTVTLTT